MRSLIRFFVASFLLIGATANAADVTLTWDAIAETTELDAYVIGYGTSSGNYTNTVTCSTGVGGDCENDTTHTITGLTNDTRYYFAVRADDSSGDGIDSAYGNEISVTVVAAADRANATFSPNVSSGTAPLTVTFTSTATGTINGYFWYFGDGSIATGDTVQHTFNSAGTYTVYHTVTGARGSDTTTQDITVN